MSPLEAQLAFLELLSPLCRSELPYRVLSEAVGSTHGISPTEEAELRAGDKNVGRALELLRANGLIRQVKRGWIPTSRGTALVRALEVATQAPPSSMLEGRRLLAVAPNKLGAIHDVERVLTRERVDVLRADGEYELMAVLPDDPGLARDLRDRIAELGHRVIATRILPSRH
jgi:hypothetical protein